MSLGQAFIEIRADLRPFIRDLDKQVKVITDQFDRSVSNSLGKTLARTGKQIGDQFGETVSDGLSNGLRRKMGDKEAPVFLRIAAALGSALDDGLSALPTQVKAAIVLGIIAAMPALGAMLTGAITAAFAVAVIGLGVGLATQFQQVQERFTDFISKTRFLLVNAAISFAPVLIRVMDLVESRISSWGVLLKTLFDATADLLIPLVNGILDAVEIILESLKAAAQTGEWKLFMNELSKGFQLLATVIGFIIRRFTELGSDGSSALRDLFALTAALITAGAALLFFLTKVWTMIKNLALELTKIVPFLGVTFYFLNKIFGGGVQQGQTSVIESNFNLIDSFDGLVSATEAEEKAVKNLLKAMDDLVEATYENIQVDIDFERSLDRISEALRENGRTLDIHTEKGRNNVETFMQGLKAAEERAINRLRVQGYTTEQAAALYNQEIAQLRELARQAGISDQQFNALFHEIIAVSSLRISSQEMGVNELEAGLDGASEAAFKLLQTLRHIARTTISGALAGVRVPGYADGEIVDRPTLAMIGEGGNREVVIPLTKPARAAQLARESGLTAILGGSGTQVLVFIGSEQLEERMVKVVERNNTNQSLALNHGPRRF